MSRCFSAKSKYLSAVASTINGEYSYYSNVSRAVAYVVRVGAMYQGLNSGEPIDPRATKLALRDSEMLIAYQLGECYASPTYQWNGLLNVRKLLFNDLFVTPSSIKITDLTKVVKR
jgi:hypothetical protein